MCFIVLFCRHGLGRTDFYILNDPELSFREIVQKNLLSAVSGSITAEMIEAAKMETSKSETIKTEVTAKAEPTKSETVVKSEETKSETAKPDEIVDTEVKLESSDGPQETKTEKVDKINNDPTSDKPSDTTSELTSTEEVIVADENQEQNNVSENVEETSSNEKSEPMDVDNEENKKDDKQEELSDIKTEQPNDKSSETIDQQTTDGENPETINAENIQSDTQEKDKDESQIHEADKTVKSDDVESKTDPSICKEINENINDISSGANNKPDIKVIDQTVKSKECSTSVESVDRLKAMFPELEVVHKDIATVATGTTTIDKLPMHKPLQQIDQTIAHLLATSYQNPIKWPKVII